MQEKQYNFDKAMEEASILQDMIKSGEALSYGEAERKMQLGMEPISTLSGRKICELPPIEKSRNDVVRERGDLAGLVERPLLSACERLYDKNITTLSSSANMKDVEFADWENPGKFVPGYGAYLTIDFDALSAKNQEIGILLGEVYFADGGNQLKITIPLNKETTFEEVQSKAEEIADSFVKQKYRVRTYSLEKMREQYGYEPDDESVQPKDFDNYFWASEHNLFFLSKEQYQKAIEEIDE